MLVFYDFEVFKHDWLVVLIEPMQGRETVIANDLDKLQRYHACHKVDIWVGYNSRRYDQFILKGLLAGFDAKTVSDWLFVQGKPGYKFSSLLNKIPLINYDVMPNPPIGLKTLEGFMGNDIKESDVDFNIDRPLTGEELEETIAYCRHDVEQTIEVFLERYAEFDSQMQLVKIFRLPLTSLNKTEAGTTAEILDGQRREWDDEFEYFFFDALRIKKYDEVISWFDNAVDNCTIEMQVDYNEARRNYQRAKTEKQREKWKKEMAKCDWRDGAAWKKYFYNRSLTITVCGVPHKFGWGGLHGAPEEPTHRKGLLLHVDVNSYYPSILITYDIISRAARHPEQYKYVYDYRLQLKREGKKKEQAPYKKVLNAMSGAMKDKYNPLYDPRNNNTMCVNGQLMLLDLLEHLEGHCELLQSNTDGLIIQIPDTAEAFEIVDNICYEWEQRTGMGLGLDVIQELWQKDVNNYVWMDADGGVERKGAYTKELSKIDNDLPIINKAMVDFMAKGIPVEETISACQELQQFQKLVKLSKEYEYVMHNGKKYLYKCYRVFASTNRQDGKIYKCRGQENPAKFAGTSDHCFILNDDITGMGIPDNLDRKWYIDLTKERLQQYGV